MSCSSKQSSPSTTTFFSGEVDLKGEHQKPLRQDFRRSHFVGKKRKNDHLQGGKNDASSGVNLEGRIVKYTIWERLRQTLAAPSFMSLVLVNSLQ